MTQAKIALGIQLARELALIGVETAVTTPQDQLPFGADGPVVHAERWQKLGQEMGEHEGSADETLVRLRDGFALVPSEYSASDAVRRSGTLSGSRGRHGHYVG